MNAIDTNILIYVHDSRDPVKQATAITLILSLANGVLLWQVACEYINASRKLGLNLTQAWQDIQDLRRVWTPLLPTWRVHDRAEELYSRYSLQVWDAFLIAACLEGKVTRLYSEDMDDSVRSEGLEIVNPFAAT